MNKKIPECYLGIDTEGLNKIASFDAMTASDNDTFSLEGLIKARRRLSLEGYWVSRKDYKKLWVEEYDKEIQWP